MHLTDWPDASTGLPDDDEAGGVDGPRARCLARPRLSGAQGGRTSGCASRSRRSRWRHRTRRSLAPFSSLVADELNGQVGRADRGRRRPRRPRAAGGAGGVLGPRLGPGPLGAGGVIKAVRAGDWSHGTRTDGSVVGEHVLAEGEYSLRLEPKDADTARGPPRQRRPGHPRHRPHARARSRGPGPRRRPPHQPGPQGRRAPRQRPGPGRGRWSSPTTCTPRCWASTATWCGPRRSPSTCSGDRPARERSRAPSARP